MKTTPSPSSPDLFESAGTLLPAGTTRPGAVLPAEPTWTQLEAALQHGAALATLQARVRACIEESEGRIPTSIAEELDANIVSVRSRCTALHQAGIIVRIPQRLAGEHVYVSRAKWRPAMGVAPSRPHRGRSQ